jgi:hypothetical protein
MSFASRMKAFNRSLHLDVPLPQGIKVLNPFGEESTLELADAFYDRFYADDRPRQLILGINPGRHGGGLTGVPFTDFKRLREVCGIPVPEARSSHEPSSTFVYQVVAAMGGPEEAYKNIYINSVCPLGFVRLNDSGRWINYNYYDEKTLQAVVTPFIVQTLQQQIELGCHTDKVIVMGKQNTLLVEQLNETYGFFDRIITVPHPRFVAQYKSRYAERYVAEYLEAIIS